MPVNITLPTTATAICILCSSAFGQVINVSDKSTAPNLTRAAEFGDTVAIEGGVTAISASRDSTNGIDSGAVYLFDSATGIELHKIFPNDPSTSSRFGSSIAMDSSLLAIGAAFDNENGNQSGSAYIFDAFTGTQKLKLLPDSSMSSSVKFFGESIAIHDGFVAVGAPLDNENGPASGSAFVFDAVTGQQIVKLLPNDGSRSDQFGRSIDIDNGLAVVGAPLDDDNGESSGSAYVFDATTGLQLSKLIPDDGAELDLFGSSVDIKNGVVAVATFGGNSFTINNGSVYIFDAVTGTQLVKLQPNENVLGQGFGSSLAIDGSVVAVGVIGDDQGGTSSGSVFLFDQATGIQTGKIFVNQPGTEGDQLGGALDLDNGILAVSATTSDINGFQSGTAYTFNVSTGDLITTLLPFDGTSFDSFGFATDISEDFIVIGAPDQDLNGLSSGAAYVYSALTRRLITTLNPHDGDSFDFFGISIAVDQNIVAVGAWRDNDNGLDSGSAYLFDAQTGIQIAKLLPDDGASEDWFGCSIDINDGIVSVGSKRDDDNGPDSGSAYLFDASTGVQIRKILPNDGAAQEWFGSSVAIDDGLVVVGARHDDENGFRSGSAYVIDALTGIQLAKLLPNDGQEEALFGSSVAIDNSIVAVGAIWADEVGERSGAAYLFDLDTGEQSSTLIPNDLSAGDRFGASVSIHQGTVAVGSMFDADNGEQSGSAYLFDALTGEQLEKLLPVDGSAGSRFGSSISINDGYIVTGAYLDDENGLNSGAFYFNNTNTPPCFADLTGDGLLDFFDVSEFLTAFSEMDPRADFTGDGFYDFLDISSFLSLFSSGCP